MRYQSWLAKGASGAIALGLCATLVGGAIAQQTQQKSTPPKQAPAQQQKQPAKGQEQAKGAPQGQQSAWVKLCEKATIPTKDKDGKEAKEDKNICLTHHERLDGNSGMVIVSAAIRQVEGSDKQHLMIMVPLGMAIPPGVRAAVYTKELWEKAQKNEKIDDKLLKPIELKYSLCHPAGCTAEAEAPKDLVDAMKAGGGMMVLALNAGAQPVGFPVPLIGFPEAHSGAPVDNKAYAQARGQLMAQIRQRQAELIKQAQDQQKAGGAQPQAEQPAQGQQAPAKK